MGFSRRGVVIPFPSHPAEVGEQLVTKLEERVLTVVADALESLDDDFESERDREAVRCEEAFHSRFGFDAPRRQRGLLLEFKHRADLTDREIRHLKRCGCLKFDRDSVAIIAPQWVEWFGWTQLALLALLGVMAATAFQLVPQPKLIHVAALIAMLAAPAYLAWRIHKIYIAPRKILRRVVAHMGA